MKRILFVDDERNILDGLRRMLRPQRAEWAMDFVESPQEALRLLDETPFDVLVTDMRMPGMDGATLLRHVRDRHPRVVRIVLSGQADTESAMRSARVSHQFLSKPCDPDELRSVVDRACRLETLLQDVELQGTLGGIGRLPVLPRTYEALTAALARPEVDLAEVGRIVESDVAITAKVLQLVNSSYFGLRREVASVRQATAYLGSSTIRDLVLTIEVFRSFDAAEKAGFSAEAEQRHALECAKLAALLLDHALGPKAKEQVFLASLLHDIGKLLLATELPDRLRDVRRLAAAEGLAHHEAEKRVLGVTHAEIGGYLLALWGMPYPVVEAVAFHHRPSAVEGKGELGILGAVHVADALLRERDGGDHPGLDGAFVARAGIEGDLDAWRRTALDQAEGEAA